MKIAILGAGFAGLAAAHTLINAHHEVTVFEKAPAAGGAAGGFKLPHWDWYLDYAYHHWFANDEDIFLWCKQIGWHNITVKRPITASAYQMPASDITHPHEVYQLDSALDLLAFPKLPLADRLRTGAVLAALKFGPALSYYHRTRAHQLLSRWMGARAWQVLWEPLMVHKFGSYAHDINAMFFWARINKRTARLCYPQGGFQALANHAADYLTKQGVIFRFRHTISALEKTNTAFIINGKDSYDAVISTLQSPIFLKLDKGVLPAFYRKRLEGIAYLGAQAVIYETNIPLVKDVYWLSIADKSNPWMVLVQHTNFIDPQHFGGKHLAYLARYTNNPLPDIPMEQYAIQNRYIPLVQPLYTTDYIDHMPHIVSPVKGLYFANMELTYPYDRGTNYAVRVGNQAAHELLRNGAPSGTTFEPI